MYDYSLSQSKLVYLQLCMLPAFKIHLLQGSTLFSNCLSGAARVWVDDVVEAESIASITLSNEDSRVESTPAMPVATLKLTVALSLLCLALYVELSCRSNAFPTMSSS